MKNNNLNDVYSGSVVINGAETITGYNAARSIAGMGFTIYGLSSQTDAVYLKAKVWDKIYTVEYDCDKLIDISKTIMSCQHVRSRKPVLMLCQDDIVLLVSKNRKKLSKYYSFILPTNDAVELMMDKTKFYDWSISKGLNVPKSIVVTHKHEIKTALMSLTYPIAIKPLNRNEGWNQKFNNSKLFKFESYPDTHSILEESLDYTEKLIFQEWIPGTDSDVHFLLAMFGSKGVSFMSGRKIHQWPVLTGSTAMCVSEIAPEYEGEAIHILQQAGLAGLGSIEFKRDPRNDKYYITEPTVGRHDYQSYVATLGGVNLSLLYVLECMGYCFINDLKPRPALWIDELNFVRAVLKKKQLSLLYKDGLIGLIKRNSSLASFTPNEYKLFIPYFSSFVWKKFKSLLKYKIKRRK
jgi:predicted ATP-grasp superfamily ATP-dependent carboligase